MPGKKHARNAAVERVNFDFAGLMARGGEKRFTFYL
jgi:hypothetical protein